MTGLGTSVGVAEVCAKTMLGILQASPPGTIDELLERAQRLGMRPQAARMGLDVLVARGDIAQDATGVVLAAPRKDEHR